VVAEGTATPADVQRVVPAMEMAEAVEKEQAAKADRLPDRTTRGTGFILVPLFFLELKHE